MKLSRTRFRCAPDAPHELPGQKACDLLKMMVDRSNIVLFADLTEAKALWGGNEHNAQWTFLWPFSKLQAMT